jgi:UDP-N-acetylenolpyruvoylglucosamine reductase
MQVWAPCILQHGPVSAAEGLTMLTNMLQLLLTVAQSGEDHDTVAAACTAVKALLHAAAAAGWDSLPSVVGLPIQVGTAQAMNTPTVPVACLGLVLHGGS